MTTNLDDPATIRALLATELPDDTRGGRTRRRLEQRLETAESEATRHQARMAAEPDLDAIADSALASHRGHATSVSTTWRPY